MLGSIEAAKLDTVLDFLDPQGLVSSNAVADILLITKPQLAATAGLSRDSVSKRHRLATPSVQRRLRDMVEILARVAPWAGGQVQAFAWYRAMPIPAFGDQTAEALVKQGRAQDVRDYLDAIAAGGFA